MQQPPKLYYTPHSYLFYDWCGLYVIVSFPMMSDVALRSILTDINNNLLDESVRNTHFTFFRKIVERDNNRFLKWFQTGHCHKNFTELLCVMISQWIHFTYEQSNMAPVKWRCIFLFFPFILQMRGGEEVQNIVKLFVSCRKCMWARLM